jgi:hypothetical protein
MAGSVAGSEAEGIYTCYNNQNLNKAAAPLEKHTAYVCSSAQRQAASK